MTRRRITSGSPFEQAYGYSRAVIEGDLIFISGLLKPEMKLEIEVTARKR